MLFVCKLIRKEIANLSIDFHSSIKCYIDHNDVILATFDRRIVNLMKSFVLFAGKCILKDEKINLPLPLICWYENPTLGLRYVQKLDRASFLDKSQPRVGFSYPQLMGVIDSLYLYPVHFFTLMKFWYIY